MSALNYNPDFILWSVYTHLMASRSYLCLVERGMPFLWNSECSERVLSGRNPKLGLRDLDGTGWNAVDLSCGVHAGDSLWWAVIQARCEWEKTWLLVWRVGQIDDYAMGKNLITNWLGMLSWILVETETYITTVLMEQFMNQREEQRTCKDPVDTKILIHL